MNRIDFQKIAELPPSGIQVLLAAGFPDGASILAGYAVECALKACISKRTREHDFPEKKLVNDVIRMTWQAVQLAELKVRIGDW